MKVATAAGAPVAEVPLVVLEQVDWPASWAAPGTPSGSGSSERRTRSETRAPSRVGPKPEPRPRLRQGRHADLARHAVLPQRRYADLRDAKVSVLDRGFIFGDGIYEVVPVYGAAPVPLRRALARLGRSLETAHPNPATPAQWLARCARLVAALAEDRRALDQLVYIQVTRGVALRDHVMPRHRRRRCSMTNPMKPATASSATTAWPASRRAISAGERGDIKSTSPAGQRCWRGRCRPTTARSRPSCSATAASPRPRPATCGDRARGRAAGRRRASMCSKASVDLLRELCEEWASPTCAPSRGRRAGADEVLLSSATKRGAARHPLDGEPVGHGALRGKPGRCTRGLFEAYQRAKASIDLIHPTGRATSRPSNR